ncbi:hypothetical protein [Spirosoma areae]
MKNTLSLLTFCLIAICGCKEQVITSQERTTSTAQGSARESSGGGIINPGGQTLPPPTITKQTFIPDYKPFAETKCQTWRITWPTYPAGTDPNLIPTVFTAANGALNSFQYLNNTSASTTYKTNFNLYNNTKLETANTLWTELTYAYGAGQKMEMAWFYKTNYTVSKIEYMVKERPSLFGTYWESASFDVYNLYTEFTYKQGDIFLFKLGNQNPYRYGGVRIVSMTPRIIEVYLAEPNN